MKGVALLGEHEFFDALTGSTVACFEASGGSREMAAGEPALCESLFFPGCSMVNYAPALVEAVYATLREAGEVDGLSVVCCGKILAYEPDGPAVQAAFTEQLRDHMAACGVRRIVAVCPNCVADLRRVLADDERTAGIEVVALPLVLAKLGYRIDEGTLRTMVAAAAQELGQEVAPEAVTVCVHDSCPDRATGEFADGTRALLPDGVLTEAPHNRKKSFCCGSLLRAAGKPEDALAASDRHGTEAVQVGASAIVTGCMSCANILSMTQAHVPAFHYLELLYSYHLNWAYMPPYMTSRFLFEDLSGKRDYVGIEGGACACTCAANPAEGEGA